MRCKKRENGEKEKERKQMQAKRKQDIFRVTWGARGKMNKGRKKKQK